MKNKELLQMLIDMERIDFIYNNRAYVAIYNEVNCSEAEALQAIKEENFIFPKFAVMTKEQWLNIFPVKEAKARGRRKKNTRKKNG